MLTDSDLNFFRPKWRRVVTTLFCVAWSVLEWVSNEPVWAVVAIGITVYCIWKFFYTFEEDRNQTDD